MEDTNEITLQRQFKHGMIIGKQKTKHIDFAISHLKSHLPFLTSLHLLQ